MNDEELMMQGIAEFKGEKPILSEHEQIISHLARAFRKPVEHVAEVWKHMEERRILKNTNNVS